VTVERDTRERIPMTTDGAPSLPDSSPDIVNPHDLTLSPAATDLLRALFPTHARLVIDNELAGGFSGSRVFAVTPLRDSGVPDLPVVVKIGPRDLVEQEHHAYLLHIRGRLSGIPEVWGDPAYSTDGAWGALRYALVGSGLFAVQSLFHYCRHADLADVVHVLESRLLVQLGALWRHTRPRSGVAFADAGYARMVSDRARTELQSVLGGALDPSRDPRAAPGTLPPALPNPLRDLPRLLAQPRDIRVATIHGDLNLDNVLVDPDARTVRIIDFAQSREDHVLHDLLRLETGVLTRLLPPDLEAAGLPSEAARGLLSQLHRDAAAEPPHPGLRRAHVVLATIRRAALPLLADPAEWSEYYDGLAIYLLGAGKYRNLDAFAKRVAFWSASAAVDLARGESPANVAALDRAITVLLARNPVLEAYRRGRVAEWSDPRYDLDERFVALSLLVDQGEQSTAGRWQAHEQRYGSLRALLEEVGDPAMVLLGPPGSGKSTILRHFELTAALAGLGDPDAPLTFFVQLSRYKPPAPGAAMPAPGDWLAARWAERFGAMPPLGDLLQGGRVILLLDALNEMPVAGDAEYRERVRDWKDFVQRLARASPACRVVFSCRSLDYSTPLSTPELRVPQAQIEPMADDQVRRFIELYAPDRAAALWRALAGTAQLGLLRAPYFLKLLVDQVAAAGEIPQGRAGLFTGFVRQALRREIERDNPLFQPDAGAGGAPLLTERDHRRIARARGWRTPWELPERGVLIPSLARLAHGMQLNLEFGETAQVRVGYDEALGLIGGARGEDVVRAGVALAVLDEDPERDEVLFFHQLLQEYFAARELAESPNPELVRLEWRRSRVSLPLQEALARLAPADGLPPLPTTGWEETAAMAAAMAEEPEAFVRGVMVANLALAGRCANQAEVRARLSAELLDKLRWAVVERSRDLAADLRHRIDCGLELGGLGDPRFERRAGPYGEYLMPPLAAIPGGSYPIGDDAPIWIADEERSDEAHVPRHEAVIAPVVIGRFPVTNAEWSCFMAAGGYEDERWWDTTAARTWRRGEGTAEGLKEGARGGWRMLRRAPVLLEQWRDGGVIGDEVYARWQRRLAMSEAEFEAHLAELYPGGRETAPRYWADGRYKSGAQPVVGICWYEARAYCAWLSAQTGLAFRLPTEVEWEAATRGTSGRTFAYGDAFDATKGNTLETHVQRPTPVGVFVEGDTPEGVSDIAGNVATWTSSAWGTDNDATQYPYPYDPADGREGSESPPNVRRVVRGGSWNYPQDLARAITRGPSFPSNRDPSTGLRLVASTPA